MSELFPVPDPWANQLDGGIEWNTYPEVPGGTRPSFLGVCQATGARAKIKLDVPHMEVEHQAFREKVCCDVAHLLRLQTPGALLCRVGALHHLGVAVRRFDGISFLLWKKAVEKKGTSTKWGSIASGAYPRSFIAFDLFVGNADRMNNGNMLVAGNDVETPVFVPIDFGTTLGTKAIPWTSGLGTWTPSSTTRPPWPGWL